MIVACRMSNLTVQLEPGAGRGRATATWGILLSTPVIPAIAFAAYFAGSLVGFVMQLPAAPHSGQIAIVWPPNAVLVSLLLLLPSARWPSVFLGTLPAHILAQWTRGTH